MTGLSRDFRIFQGSKVFESWDITSLKIQLQDGQSFYNRKTGKIEKWQQKIIFSGHFTGCSVFHISLFISRLPNLLLSSNIRVLKVWQEW